MAMSRSDQPDLVALVSADDQAHVGEIVNKNVRVVDFVERQAGLESAQEVLRCEPQYTEPTCTIQRVCDHPAQIIALPKESTNLMPHQFLPL